MSINTALYNNIEYYKNNKLKCYTNPTISKVINITTNSNPARLYIALFSNLYDNLLFDSSIHNILDKSSKLNVINTFDELNKLNDVLYNHYSSYVENIIELLHSSYIQFISEIDNKPLPNDLHNSNVIKNFYNSKCVTNDDINVYDELFDKYFIKPFKLSKITTTGIVKQFVICCDNLSNQTNLIDSNVSNITNDLTKSTNQTDSTNFTIIQSIINSFVNQLKQIDPSIDIVFISSSTNYGLSIMRNIPLNHITCEWLQYIDDDDINISFLELSKLFLSFIHPPKQIYNFSQLVIKYAPTKQVITGNILNNFMSYTSRIISTSFMLNTNITNSGRLSAYEDDISRINEFVKCNLLNLNIIHDNERVNTLKDDSSVICTLSMPIYITKESSCRCNNNMINDTKLKRLCLILDLYDWLSYYLKHNNDEANISFAEFIDKFNIKHLYLLQFMQLYHFQHKYNDLNKNGYIGDDEANEILDMLNNTVDWIKDNMNRSFHHADEVVVYYTYDDNKVNQLVNFVSIRHNRKAKIINNQIEYNNKIYTINEWNEYVRNGKCCLLY